MKGLLDTGADVSVISLDALPENAPIERVSNNLRLTSASNNPIACIGIVPGLPIRYNGKSYIVNALITSLNMKYLILGRDFIEKYPALLTQKIKNKENQVRKELMAEMNILHLCGDDTLEKHKDIFNNEISPATLCTRVNHKIDTNEERPRRQYNGRIPVHIDTLIRQELQGMLERGIISKSRRAWCSKLVPIIKPDGRLRLCVDSSHINAITEKETYPIPK